MTSSPSRLSRLQDHSSQPVPRAATALKHHSFWGDWQNTDENSTGIVRVTFFDKDGALFMQVFGKDEEGTIDWGEAPVQVLADEVDSDEGTKFGAVYHFDFMEVRMHGWVKLGVLVIALFNQFTDDSGRSNYFDREFFHAAPPAND